MNYLMYGIIILVFFYVLFKIYSKKIYKYPVVFGNTKIYYLMIPDKVIKILGRPFRQICSMQKEILEMDYYINVYGNNGIIKYIFMQNNFEEKNLKKVAIKLECNNFSESQKMTKIIKDKILEYYGTRVTYNDYEEKTDLKKLSNDFGIQRMDFNIKASNNIVNLKIDLQ